MALGRFSSFLTPNDIRSGGHCFAHGEVDFGKK